MVAVTCVTEPVLIIAADTRDRGPLAPAVKACPFVKFDETVWHPLLKLISLWSRVCVRTATVVDVVDVVVDVVDVVVVAWPTREMLMVTMLAAGADSTP